VADFIGSPPMNFIPFRGRVQPGDKSVQIGDATVAVPEAEEGAEESDLVLGARPEHVRLSADSPLRASVVDAEYLGTTQIVTLLTAQGATLKARIPADVPARPGDQTGLTFRAEKLSVFQKASGRALRSALHQETARG
jgi:multiple sugar transport system ATP-binding protein